MPLAQRKSASLIAPMMFAFANPFSRAFHDEANGDAPGDADGDGTANATQTQAFDADKFADRIGDKFKETAKEIKDGFQSQIDALNKRIDDAVKTPGENVADVFTGGKAPMFRQGESILCENRGYQFFNIFRAIRDRDTKHAKLEMELSDKLEEAYGNTGGGGIRAPLGAEFMIVEDSLKREIRDVVQMGATGFDRDELQWHMQRARVNQDLSLYDETKAGNLLGPVQYGEMIDLLRAQEIISRVGARSISFPSNGRIVWPRHTGDMSAYWVGESQTITESDVTTGSLTMAVKKLAAITDIPNDLLKFATGSVEMLVRSSIAEKFARELDSKALFGAAGSQLHPRGITTYTATGEIVQHTATVTDTDGDTLMPEDVYLMPAKVAENNINVDNFTYVMRPLMLAKVKTRRADSVSANDAAGPFIFTTEPSMNSRLNAILGGYGVVQSTTVRGDRAKGSATDLTEVIGGNFQELLVGRMGVIEFDTDPYSGNSGANFKKDVLSLRGIQYCDTMPRRPEAFVHCDNLVFN